MSVVRLEGVFKAYHVGKFDYEAVHDITLSVDEGEFLSIAGPSGSGKTTILNIMGCLDKPSLGKVYIEDKDVTDQPMPHLAIIRREKIGFIFQTFNLIPVLTAVENVEFPLILEGIEDAEERRSLAKKFLSQVGLEEFIHRRPNELSGGQQQRVAIARALAKKPSLVLADEPTANLDSNTGKEILEIMLDLNQSLSTTFVFSTHDRMVMDFARRLIRLKDGRIEEDRIISQ
jgi:putative ABC transport system ATP-binding protein